MPPLQGDWGRGEGRAGERVPGDPNSRGGRLRVTAEGLPATGSRGGLLGLLETPKE